MLNFMKKAAKKIPILVEHIVFVSPKKSRFSLWYEDKVLERRYSMNLSGDAPLVPVQPEWLKVNRVKFSGVCVLSEAKVVMCRPRPSSFCSNHSEYRKAIACTRHYRPLKYPGAQSILHSLQSIRNNLDLWLGRKRSGELSGRVALLGNCVFEDANYYHFLTDVIGDIWYISKNINGSKLPDYYLVPFAGLAWQWDILRLCGLRDDQVIPYSRYDLLSLEELIIPVRDKGAVNLPPWLSSAIHQLSGWEPRSGKGERLIFVSRADANRRRVVNEAVIRERLVQEGFEVYTLDGMSFREQQSLFASASIICAPHGAALTNLVWCGPGTVIIDLLSERHLIPCFRELAAQNRLFYYPYACKQVGDVASGINGDIIVSDSQIESVLDIVDQHDANAGYSLTGQTDKVS